MRACWSRQLSQAWNAVGNTNAEQTDPSLQTDTRVAKILTLAIASTNRTAIRSVEAQKTRDLSNLDGALNDEVHSCGALALATGLSVVRCFATV